MKSIRQYLLWGMLAALLLAFFISLMISYRAISHEVEEVYNAQLVQDARFIEGFLNQPQQKISWSDINQALAHINQINFSDDDEENEDGHSYERKLAIQIWDTQGNLLLNTPNAPNNALSPLKKGFFHRQYNTYDWYIYTHQIPNKKYWLIVAERADIRVEIITKMLSSLLIGNLMAIMLIAILVGWIITTGLSPLHQLSQAMQQRDLDYLQPIKLSDSPPNELKPVLNALNHLLDRLDEGIERERRFLADAAHELRTPLSVLKLQLELASQSIALEQKQQGIEDALMGVNRSTHTVEQLLTLARLEANKQALQRDEIDLVGLVQEVTASLYPLAQQKEQNLELDYQQDLMIVKANRVLINVLVRNLIENAIKYSPSNSTIHILLKQDVNQLCLKVRDQGQGVPEEDLNRLTQRFYRHEQSSDTRGTGLGLSIVQKILDLHDGNITFQNRPTGGLSVSVCLPTFLN